MSDMKAITSITISYCPYKEKSVDPKKNIRAQSIAEDRALEASLRTAEKMYEEWAKDPGDLEHGIRAKIQRTIQEVFSVSFLTKDNDNHPPRFPMGFPVRRKDDGRLCKVESFIWFPPAKDYIFKVRPVESELAPSDWHTSSRLLGPIDWTMLLQWAEDHNLEFKERSGRFHKGNSFSASIDDLEHQMKLHSMGISPVWDKPEENPQPRLIP